MIVILSPAKKLERKELNYDIDLTNVRHISESIKLNERLKEFNPDELGSLMKISDKLTDYTLLNIHKWTIEEAEHSFPCILGFNGEAFRGLDITSYSKEDLEYANSHLRVLSGLYGVLRPLDLICSYRLEMGTKLNIGKHKNLYSFWGEKINKTLIEDIKDSESDILVNLASNEYSKSAKLNKMKGITIVTPVFKEFKNGKYKVVTVHAKRARGLMATYIMKNRIENVEGLKKFNEEGYIYREDLSNNEEMVFTLG